MNKLIICFLFITLPISILCQERKLPAEQEIPTSCELVQRILGTVHELAGSTKIVVVSRLGTGEFSAVLNRSRLKNVKRHLETAWKRPAHTIILAQGERTAGLGRLEFYIHGDLADEIVAKKKKNIPIICYIE